MDKFKEGMRLPTLIKQLQKILEQYPDDGQILKELIQNAEDAGVSGATQIKFLIDYSSYGTETLYQPDLKDFQGPALYVYNDALFTEDDWDGIRSLHESIKEDDPMKVGRFGLGFKSVFHLTDLPSIFSDKGIGFIDPHMRYFEREVEGKSYKEKTSCFLFNLEKDQQIVSTLADQFAPFCQEVFGISKDILLKERRFPGTLFRFPFRTYKNREDSEISQTVYDKKKIESLIKSLITDSHNSLLFLKNLERIEVYEKFESGDVKLKFKVSVSESCRDWIRKQRQDFIYRMNGGKVWTQSNSAVVTYPIAFDITKYSTDGKQSLEPETWWIVTQYFAGQEDARLGNMQQDNRYLPLVGIAQKINFHTSNTSVFAMPPNGHIFCFLPLPMEQESPTGFRVHVNGSFSVDHNRRHLKWAPSDLPVTSIVDKDLLWNLFLVSQVVPNAFKAQLRFMVSIGRRSDDVTVPRSFITALDKEKPEFLSQHIYAVIPEPRIIRSQWFSVVKTVVDELPNISIFYTLARNGKYLNSTDAIFDVLDEKKSPTQRDLDLIIRKILIEDNRNAVNVPGYVFKMLPTGCQQINAALVAEALRSVQDDLEINDSEKVKLLDYCFRDSSKIPDLTVVKLLPLANGTWTTFTKQPDANLLVYFENDQHRQEFLPGLERRFLKTSGFSANTLMMLKQQKMYQLRELTAATVAELMPTIFNSTDWPCDRDDFVVSRQIEWFDMDWLDMIWEYLRQYHIRSLSMFENLPIVPITKNRVARLSFSSAIVAKSLRSAGKTEQLSSDKIKLCSNLGIKIMEIEDSEILQHPLIWKTYLQSPNDSGIITAMFKLSHKQNISSAVDNLDASDRSTLRAVLAEGAKTLSWKEVEIIKSLKIFKSISQNVQPESNFSSICDTKIALARQMTLLPLANNVIVLDLAEDSSRKLANFLGVFIPTRAKFIKEIYLSYIATDSCTLKDRKTLMLYLLDNWNDISHEDYTECCNLAAIIRNIAFITTTKDSLVRPIDIYDSTVNRLKILFSDSDFDVFPGDEFVAPKYSNIMMVFGMKDESSIGNDEVLRIAKYIQASQTDTDVKRSMELMKFLNGILIPGMGSNEQMNLTVLKEELSQIKWLTISNERPESYPRHLVYASESSMFASPKEVLSSRFDSLIGSVQKVLQTNNLANLAKLFGWSSNPTIDKISQHLLNVVDSFTMEEQTIVQNIVRRIYQHLQNNCNDIPKFVERMGNRSWIWNGGGFSAVDEIVFKSDLDLRPYSYTLPVELRSYTELWQHCNILQQCDLLNVLQRINIYHTDKHNISKDIVTRDINLCMQILNRIASTSNPIPETILIPIQTHDEQIQMREKKDCAYCDAQWIKSGMNILDLEPDVSIVHESVPLKLCSMLKIDSLVNKTVGAESLDFSYGQSEKLTSRLNDILRGYNDGLAVFKELIQNADDAGAKEIHFLYDERENQDAKSILLDPGMAELQGPALWIYNDAEFNEADFANITKISSASKEYDTGKVGRFGIGFNVVYNLTDAPMFMSNNYIAIFDPHTKYLGNMITDKSKPGVRLNLKTHRLQIQRVSDQFKPFDNIFNCDFSCSDVTAYSGTLFRLPLRTYKQAEDSEICKLVYNNAEVMTLIGLLSKAGHQLLLYTQSLSKISVSHLARNSLPPNDTHLWFSICKQIETIIRNPNPEVPILRQAFEKIQQFVRKPKRKGRTYINFEVSILFKIATDYSSFIPGGLAESERTSYWLVVSCLGQKDSLKLSLESNGRLLPMGGAAAKLQKGSDNVYQAVSVADGQRTGAVFCFMPLPISTTFPVHINGYFEVHSSRTHIYEIVANDKESDRGLWNQALLQDAVARAYVLLLQNLASLCGSNNCYDLWPSHRSLDEIGFMSNLTEAFYKIVCSEDPEQTPSIFYSSGCVKFHECLMLEAAFREEEVAVIALSVLKTLVSLLYAERIKCIDLTVDIQRTILMTSSKNCLKNHQISKNEFFKQFLDNIHNIDSIERDKLMIYALLDKDILFRLRSIQCIPVTPNGSQLKLPTEIINPRSKLSPLYESEEGRFPCFNHEDFRERADDICTALTTIGMQNDDLSWEEICVRCEMIENRPIKASIRTPIVMTLIEDKLESGDRPDLSIIEKLTNIKFIIPARTSSNNFLKWKGEELAAGQLISLKDGFLKCLENLVSCSCYVIDELLVFGGRHCTLTKEIFGLSNKRIPVCTVAVQLLWVAKLADNVGCIKHIENYASIIKIHDECFSQLNRIITEGLDSPTKLAILKKANSILIEAQGYLLKPYQCALSTQTDLNGLLPYMANISRTAERKYCEIYRHIGVKNKFDIGDYARVLETIQSESKGLPLNSEQLGSINTAIGCICKILESSIEMADSKVNNDLFVPNSKGVLCRKSELCYNTSWIKDERDNYCHDQIPPAWARILGIRPLQEELMRERKVPSFKFGQKEELINRINRLLDGYLCDVTILRELLQNADDSGATELHFIIDARNLPAKKVFQDSWKMLQGPALCVYNNKSFKQSDIEGIQKIGEGSKSGDTTKTGQYGVGFNCVYNLTDVPSFLTNAENIGPALCVFDPNCKYAPDANEQSPGGMYRVSAVIEKFPDVFQGYLQDFKEYEIEKEGTIFRLPLRTFDMLQCTRIRGKKITVSDMKDMLKKFMSDMYEMLLFVRNVRSISVREITTDKKNSKAHMRTLYKVESKLSRKTKEAILDFEKYVKDLANQIRPKEDRKEAEMTICQIEPKEIIYEIVTSDSLKKSNTCTWQIVQRFGFHKDYKLLPNLVHRIKKGELQLLPLGGIAYLKKGYLDKPMRYFCYLPLSLNVKLPVHINGHFALNNETRRDIWTDPSDALKRQWNISLMEGILAPAYCSLLTKLNSELSDPKETSQDDDMHRVTKYLKIFPNIPIEYNNLLSELTKAIYTMLWTNNMPLLPLRSGAKNASQVKWCGPKGSEDGLPAYFDDLDMLIKDKNPLQVSTTNFGTVVDIPVQGSEALLSKSTIILDTLCRCGMNMFDCKIYIYANFMKAKQNVLKISPASVLEFLSKYSFGNKGKFPALPEMIDKTPLQDTNSLTALLEYCASDETYKDKLIDLPLLVTYDQMVHKFETNNVKYACNYEDIALHVPNKFIIPAVHKSLRLNPKKDTKLCKHLDVNEFNSILSATLPADQFYGENKKILLKLLTDRFKNTPNWLKTVFKFLHEESKLCQIDHFVHLNTDEKFNVQQESLRSINAIKNVLSHWCLLPVSFNGCEMLFTLGEAGSILQAPASSVLSDANFTKLFNILQTLGCSVFLVDHLGDHGTKFAQRIIGCSENPENVACALNDLLKTNANALSKVKDLFGQTAVILEYFSNNVQNRLTDIQKISHLLKELPFFETIYNKLVPTKGTEVFVLPMDIPKDGMETWTSSLGVNFLKEKASLNPLYELLGFKQLSVTDVYCQQVLKKFCLLNEGEKQKHLYYIKGHLDRKRSSTRYIENTLKLHPKGVGVKQQSELQKMKSEIELLKRNLQCLQFIPNLKGTYETACSYFDHTVNVFASMESKFLPNPYCEPHLIDFMRDCGLIHEVSQDTFLKYAKLLEKSTVTDEIKTKSQVLLTNFLSRDDLDDDFLSRVKDIKFISPHKISDSLLQLRPQSLSEAEGLIAFNDSTFTDYCKVVWTAQPVLPLSSEKFLEHMEESKRKHICQYLNIDEKPTCNSVAEHAKQLYEYLLSKNEKALISATHKNLLTDVLTEICEFLQSHIPLKNNKLIRKLKSLHFIPVEDMPLLVTPEQIVIDISSDYEISPYLFRIPLKFGKFKPLLLHLGATEKPTPEQYAEVLKLLYYETKDTVTNQNQRSAVVKAISRYFDLVSNHNLNFYEFDKLPIFYLPCTDKKLYPSWETIIVDNPDVGARVNFDDIALHHPVVVNFNLIRIDNAKALSILTRFPEALRPQLMSKIIVEETSNEGHVTSDFVDELKRTLECDELQTGLKHIMQHIEQEIPLEQLNSNHKTAMENIRNIKFAAHQRVSTILKFKDKLLAGSALERQYMRVTSNGQVIYHINQDFHGEALFYEDIARVIFMNLCEYARDGASLLATIIQYKPDQMLKKLKEIGVKLYKDIQKQFIAPLGSHIPNCEHGLLEADIFLLWKNQLVALQIDDPIDRGEAGQPTYILVKILEVIDDSTSDERNLKDLTMSYKIQLSGNQNDFKIVDASLLQAFRSEKIQEGKKWSVALYEGTSGEPSQERSEPHRDFHSAAKYIKEKLKGIFRVEDETIRKRLTRRIMFEFHHDKNKPDMEDLYKKLFQRLLNFVEMLENEKSIDDPSNEEENWEMSDREPFANSASSSTCRSNWLNDDFLKHMNDRAKRHKHYNYNHRRNRQGGKYNFGKSSGKAGGSTGWGETEDSGSSERANQESLFESFRTEANSQPGEAMIWLNQAELDLDAAVNDGSEAICAAAPKWKSYKSYIAAMKSLQAAQYAKDCNKIKIKGQPEDFFFFKLTSFADVCRDLGSPNLLSLAGMMDNLMSDVGARKLQHPRLQNSGMPLTSVTEDQAEEIYHVARNIYDGSGELVRQCSDYSN